MSKESMIESFKAWLKKQVGCIYVWGGQGETEISEKWIRSMETSEENANRAIAFWKKRIAAGAKGLAAYDCSGLITVFLLEHGIIHSDITSRGLFAICDEIKRSELKAGDLVFRHNGESIYHVGVYTGDGRVIHARGRDYGVVDETLNANGEGYWNRYGRLSGISGDAIANEGTETRDKYPKAMEYTGSTYVNLRSAPDSSASANVIGKVSRGDVVMMLQSVQGTWAEVIKRVGDRFLRGYCVQTWLAPVSGEEF